jgi:branched-chain amino acid aminotransferase
MSLVWINGTLVDKADARVSPFDHGFLYGDGVWEPFRVFRGHLFRLTEHLTQLFDAAAELRIDIPLTREGLTAAIEATVQANHRIEGYGRVIVTRGPGTIGSDPRKLDPQVFITTEEYQPFPLELYGHGLHVVTAPVRLLGDHPARNRRTLNQLHVVLAKQHALKNGCLEAVLLATDGLVAGCTEGQLALIDGRNVRCPGGGDPVAGGLAAELAREEGLSVVDDPVTVDDLLAAQEVFLIGTSCGVIGIVRVDGKEIASGTEGGFTRAIRQRYRVLTRGE